MNSNSGHIIGDRKSQIRIFSVDETRPMSERNFIQTPKDFAEKKFHAQKHNDPNTKTVNCLNSDNSDINCSEKVNSSRRCGICDSCCSTFGCECMPCWCETKGCNNPSSFHAAGTIPACSSCVTKSPPSF